MSVYSRTTAERKRIMQDYRVRHEEIPVALNRPRPLSPKAQLEQEKKIRREIANSNERRRMQSINAGFQSLKTLLPHHAGEKLSKAAILQQTSEYIASLERDKNSVMAENDRLRQQLMNVSNTLNTINTAVAAEESPPPKRKKRDTESSDEGIGLCEESSQLDEMRKKLLDIQLHFDHEKRLRLKFEDRSKVLEAKLQKLSNHVLDQETVINLNETDSKPVQPLFNSSMSRRNLQTIVEAIRHLEGDRLGPFDESNGTASSVPSEVSSITESSPLPIMAHQHSTPIIRRASYLAPGDNDIDNKNITSDSLDHPEDYKSNAGSDISSPVAEDDEDDIDCERDEDEDSECMKPVDFSTTNPYNQAASPKQSFTPAITSSSLSGKTSLTISSSSSIVEPKVAKSPLQHQMTTSTTTTPLSSDYTPSVVKANPSSCYKESFLTPTSLIHRPSPPYVNQLYRRPGVIVHKS